MPITQIIPAPNDWECLILLFDDAFDKAEPEYVHLDILPIIAFGLNAGGEIVPVTPMHSADMPERYAIRQKGHEKLYSEGDEYSSLEDWIALMRWIESQKEQEHKK